MIQYDSLLAKWKRQRREGEASLTKKLNKKIVKKIMHINNKLSIFLLENIQKSEKKILHHKKD